MSDLLTLSQVFSSPLALSEGWTFSPAACKAWAESLKELYDELSDDDICRLYYERYGFKKLLKKHGLEHKDEKAADGNKIDGYKQVDLSLLDKICPKSSEIAKNIIMEEGLTEFCLLVSYSSGIGLGVKLVEVSEGREWDVTDYDAW